MQTESLPKGRTKCLCSLLVRVGGTVPYFAALLYLYRALLPGESAFLGRVPLITSQDGKLSLKRHGAPLGFPACPGR